MRNKIFRVSLIAIASIVIMFAGCQTIPSGWGDASASAIQVVSGMLSQVLFDSEKDPDLVEMKKCIFESGLVGSAEFVVKRVSGKDIDEALLSAVNKSNTYAKNHYEDLYNANGNLPKIILSYLAIKVPSSASIINQINDSDLLLSLINVVLNVGKTEVLTKI